MVNRTTGGRCSRRKESGYTFGTASDINLRQLLEHCVVFIFVFVTIDCRRVFFLYFFVFT